MLSAYRVRSAAPGSAGRADTPVPADREWLTYLQEICELLWPSPAVVTMEKGRPGWLHAPAPARPWARGAALPEVSEFGLVPGLRRPPLLVPAGRRAASAAVRHYSGQRSPAARLGARALALGLAGSLGGTVLCGRIRVKAPAGADSIEAYLRDVMERDIWVSMSLGPARANRKPVLELITAAGEPVAFAKVGVNRLTRDLVRVEHDSLARLGRAGLGEITVPRVQHYGQWRGLDVLVISALPAWRLRRPLPATRLATAMRELAGVGGLRREPLLGSEYLRQLRGRLEAVDKGPERAALLTELDALSARAGDTTVTFGAWHGDWAPWNMASTRRGLMVWDWERFTRGVPLGFDALHHWLQAQVGPRHRDAPTAAAGCIERVGELLAQFGIGAREARLTAVLYLAELATRYLADRQAEAGPTLAGAPGTWLIPAIAAEVARW